MKKKNKIDAETLMKEAMPYAEDLKRDFENNKDHFFMRLGVICVTMFKLSECIENFQKNVKDVLERRHD